VGSRSDRFPGVEWIEGAGDFIKVNSELCDACARCLKVCLGDCFEIVDKKARVKSLAECMECASCWFVCERCAIDFSWPPGGKGYKSLWG
jgi:NAD-dependent dihydropyrimidine dehydrogenase PreA subunit